MGNLCDCCATVSTEPLHHVHAASGAELWCGDCVDRLCYECEKCGEIYSNENAFPLNSDGICWNCISIRNDIIHDRYRDEL